MKKIIIVLLAVSATLALSCKKEEIGNTGAPGTIPIVFGIDGNSIGGTKVFSESTLPLVQANGFNVAGVTSENVTMFNALASWVPEKSYYKTDETYCYPASGGMNFYAVYPKSQPITVSGGAVTLAYANNPDTDLIASSATNVTASERSVALAFNHILGQVSFTVKGTDNNVEYKLRSISVSAPGTGTYAYSSASWTKGEAIARTTYFSGEASVSTKSAQAIGGAQTYLPVEVQVNVEWDCYSKGVLVASYNKSTGVTLTKGKKTAVNLNLPNSDAKVMNFTVSVKEWETTTPQEITL